MEYLVFALKFIGAVTMVAGEWMACITWPNITTTLPWTKKHTISYGTMAVGAIIMLGALQIPV